MFYNGFLLKVYNPAAKVQQKLHIRKFLRFFLLCEMKFRDY